MAGNLTDTWNQHAFPDEMPGREERWSQESEKRRIQDRLDLYLEQSGAGLKLRRFTSLGDNTPDGKSAKDRAADDLMLLTVGSPAYMRAYNTQLRFQIDGKDVEISQGKLYDLAKKRAEELRRQIDEAKQRGASTDEVARMQENLDAWRIVHDNTNPALGPMTPERHQRIQAAMNSAPDVKQDVMNKAGALRRSPDKAEMQKEDTSRRVDNDGKAQDGSLHEAIGADTSGASVAGGLSDNPFAENAPALKSAFAAVAPDAPVPPAAPDDKPAFPVPPQNNGFGPA